MSTAQSFELEAKLRLLLLAADTLDLVADTEDPENSDLVEEVREIVERICQLASGVGARRVAAIDLQRCDLRPTNHRQGE